MTRSLRGLTSGGGAVAAAAALTLAVAHVVLPAHAMTAAEVRARSARQPQILERALAGLMPGRPGVPDLYFVGFGADSRQDVFMKEVQSARSLFEERFDAGGRSLALVNNVRTLEELPLASTTNLRTAVRRVAQAMDVHEDVLFLYLTGHGSASTGLSVKFRFLEPENLEPAGLRRLLDAAGIKWRVIVISACYSGHFVAPLQTEQTFIATSAAASRRSYGCEPENDSTYFGRAYFGQALRETRSFVDAFHRASALVLDREEAVLQPPSRPQLYVGSAIRRKLEHLERRLENGARPRAIRNAWAAPPPGQPAGGGARGGVGFPVPLSGGAS
jgi:hypothetical protein